MIDIQTAALVGQVVFGIAALLSTDAAAHGLLWMASVWCLGVNLGCEFYKRRGSR